MRTRTGGGKDDGEEDVVEGGLGRGQVEVLLSIERTVTNNRTGLPT